MQEVTAFYMSHCMFTPFAMSCKTVLSMRSACASDKLVNLSDQSPCCSSWLKVVPKRTIAHLLAAWVQANVHVLNCIGNESDKYR